jgi:hypothetical protein
MQHYIHLRKQLQRNNVDTTEIQTYFMPHMLSGCGRIKLETDLS